MTAILEKKKLSVFLTISWTFTFWCIFSVVIFGRDSIEVNTQLFQFFSVVVWC